MITYHSNVHQLSSSTNNARLNRTKHVHPPIIKQDALSLSKIYQEKFYDGKISNTHSAEHARDVARITGSAQQDNRQFFYIHSSYTVLLRCRGFSFFFGSIRNR
jgi:hypothetical protein